MRVIALLLLALAATAVAPAAASAAAWCGNDVATQDPKAGDGERRAVPRDLRDPVGRRGPLRRHRAEDRHRPGAHRPLVARAGRDPAAAARPLRVPDGVRLRARAARPVLRTALGAGRRLCPVREPIRPDPRRACPRGLLRPGEEVPRLLRRRGRGRRRLRHRLRRGGRRRAVLVRDGVDAGDGGLWLGRQRRLRRTDGRARDAALARRGSRPGERRGPAPCLPRRRRARLRLGPRPDGPGRRVRRARRLRSRYRSRRLLRPRRPLVRRPPRRSGSGTSTPRSSR